MSKYIPTGVKRGPKTQILQFDEITVLNWLKIHSSGATTPELAAYSELHPKAVYSALKSLESQGLVQHTSTHPKNYLWSLSADQTADSPPQQSPRLLTQQPRSHNPSGVGGPGHSLHHG